MVAARDPHSILMSFGRCCCVVAVLLLACASCALAEHADVDAAAVKVGASSFSLEASSGDRKLLMEHDDDIDNAHAQVCLEDCCACRCLWL